MKAWLKKYETPLVWVYAPALIVSMLSFPIVGLWMYIVFAALGIPAVLGSIYMLVRGQRLGQDGWIMVVAVTLFLVFGARHFI